MKEIHVSQCEYGKALRNVHPMDRFDANKRVVNAVGRLTASKLNKSQAFADAIESKNMKSAGNMWHNTANKIAKTFAARLQKITGANLKSEHTIKSGIGGSRADLLFDALNTLAEFDWKTTAKSALKSVKQMARHAEQLKEKTGAKPAVQESRSWVDYVRELAPNAAKFLSSAVNGKTRGSPSSAVGNNSKHSQCSQAGSDTSVKQNTSSLTKSQTSTSNKIGSTSQTNALSSATKQVQRSLGAAPASSTKSAASGRPSAATPANAGTQTKAGTSASIGKTSAARGSPTTSAPSRASQGALPVAKSAANSSAASFRFATGTQARAVASNSGKGGSVRGSPTTSAPSRASSGTSSASAGANSSAPKTGSRPFSSGVSDGSV